MSDATFSQSLIEGNSTTDSVKKILGLAFIKVADKYEDLHHNTDLYFPTPSGEIVRFSMRMRTVDYLTDKHKCEFTLCCHRHNGGDAEYQKIMGTGKEKKHYGDYMVYGFQNKSHDAVLFCVIIDLNKFREWRTNNKLDFIPTSDSDENVGDLKLKGTGEIVGHCLPVRREDDKTGDYYYDYFYAFDWTKIPEIVVATLDDLKGL